MNIKKLNLRLEQVRESQIAQELTRLGIELCSKEEAAAYRNQRKKQ